LIVINSNYLSICNDSICRQDFDNLIIVDLMFDAHFDFSDEAVLGGVVDEQGVGGLKRDVLLGEEFLGAALELVLPLGLGAALGVA